MNWHERYVHQAEWTRELRGYLFRRAGLSRARRVLEVGCGTGAILSAPPLAMDNQTVEHTGLYGLDVDLGVLSECRAHVARACLTCGDALALPYASRTFDVTFCHFLLLWVSTPAAALGEMRRVTVPSGFVLALAEPDYGSRLDEPSDLAALGRMQNAALERQGAVLRCGAELSESFRRAGIRVIETGRLQARQPQRLSENDWHREWQVLEHDLEGAISAREMLRFKALDRQARLEGRRRLDVPTYFACGQV